jgi:LacI family transcriptional regulator
MVAIGAMQALTSVGKKPGLDFAIVGFNNIAESALCRPALTTVDTAPQKVGEMAAEMLLVRMAHPNNPYHKQVVQPQLVVRGSSWQPRFVPHD